MGAYNLKQEIDFVFRTQQILNQYEQFIEENPKIKGFEFTLLLNCFVGLLIIPQQTNERGNDITDLLPTAIIDEESFGIDPSKIIICAGKGGNPNTRLAEDKSVANIVRHFRNSVAHSRFEIKSKDSKISSVYFEDRDNAHNQTFE
jgi:hypothetical protein